MNEKLKPKDHAEDVAIFRAQIIGPLLCRGGMSHVTDIGIGWSFAQKDHHAFDPAAAVRGTRS